MVISPQLREITQVQRRHNHVVNGIQPPRGAEFNTWAATTNEIGGRFAAMACLFSGIVAMAPLRPDGGSLEQRLYMIAGGLLSASGIRLLQNGINLNALKEDVAFLKELGPYMVFMLLLRIGFGYLTKV